MRQKTFNVSIYFFVFILFLPFSGAQEITKTESCMECHADKSAEGERNGKKISIFVDVEGYKKSVHSGLACVDCHADIKEFPHNDELKKVDCAACHEEANVIESASPGGNSTFNPSTTIENGK